MNLRRVNLATLATVPDEHPFVAGVMELPPDTWADLTDHGYLGVGYWREVVSVPTFDADTHKLGGEILTVDVDTKTVNVTNNVVALTAEELAVKLANKRVAIQAEIDRLEGYPNYLNRGARELQLRLMEKEATELAAARGLSKEQVLAATPYYGKLKSLDDEIKALRVQL